MSAAPNYRDGKLDSAMKAAQIRVKEMIEYTLHNWDFIGEEQQNDFINLCDSLREELNLGNLD